MATIDTKLLDQCDRLINQSRRNILMKITFCPIIFFWWYIHIEKKTIMMTYRIGFAMSCKLFEIIWVKNRLTRTVPSLWWIYINWHVKIANFKISYHFIIGSHLLYTEGIIFALIAIRLLSFHAYFIWTLGTSLNYL